MNLPELSSKLQVGELSSREIVDFYLERIEKLNPTINAVTSVFPEEARRAAMASDERRRQGNLRSEWDGIPIAIKDILCTKGVPTTCGSKILSQFRPPYDATVVEKLSDAGMILIAKTNLDEFAMGGSTETSIFGATKNPWDRTRTCGGSSGGSAAVIAARMAPVSVGTDTGGSIRQPASYCGICGLKPTYGRVSRYGLIAYASSLDSIGPMGQKARDLHALFSILAGHDGRDSTSIDQPMEPPEWQSLMHQAPRIGVVREYLEHDGLDAEVRKSIEEAIEVMRRGGAIIKDVSLPHSRYGVPTYYIIAPSEASSNLSRYDGAHYGYRATAEKGRSESPLVEMYCRSRSEGFGAEVKRRVMLGTYALSSGYYDAYYLKALKVRRLIKNDYDQAFREFDCLLGPTTPRPAFRLGEKLEDPVQMYLEDWFTVGANLAGNPAVSIPCGTTTAGLPIGLQLQAAPLGETKLLQIADWYQQLVDYHPSVPEGI